MARRHKTALYCDYCHGYVTEGHFSSAHGWDHASWTTYTETRHTKKSVTHVLHYKLPPISHLRSQYIAYHDSEEEDVLD